MLLHLYHFIHALYRVFPVNSIYYRANVRELFGWVMTRLVSPALLPIHQHCFGEIQGEYIISLTSFGKRVNEAFKTILSLKYQNGASAKIILWLGEDEWNFQNIPSSLTLLLDERFEIRFVENLGSHKKYFFAMKEHPSKHIILCDDDYIYPPSFLKLLIESHKKSPENVHCYSARRIKYSSKEGFLPYRQWTYSRPNDQRFLFKLLPLGGGGVLFPCGIFSTTDLKELRMLIEEFKTTDDLLLLAFLLTKGKYIYQLDYINKLFIPSYPQGKYQFLAKNNLPFQNDLNWNKLNKKFQLFRYFSK
ncbi:glycosyltransferase [Belliella sp. R4-6]|uniref:Glycosyltransferase n=1 Tax=Belliella alkalica TaxID=1730871 RepID=A0ABS9V6K3_9BACT|nr:glycosyltransferase [Belliella alkalica]MCH7412047.1 glycosyltransferase [Belliella alkalica]